MREDINLVAAVRKQSGRHGDMTDANQAQSSTVWHPELWDFRRALETARELEKLNVYWLEEPLRRYEFDALGAEPSGRNSYRRWREIILVCTSIGRCRKGVFDILQPDIMVARGVTGFRENHLWGRIQKRVIPHTEEGT